MESINYNYFKIVDKDNEIIGVAASEKGSSNEFKIVDGCMELGFKIERSTKEEYEKFDGDEVKNH